MKEPKEKIEEVKTPEQYEKVIDSLVGVSTVFPDNIKINDTDTMVQTMVISNAVTQEKFRRQLTVTNIEKSDNQTKFTFQVQAILRDDHGVAQAPITTNRTLIVAQTANGYQFYGDGTDYTVFSWDFLVGLRGFCNSYENDTSYVTLTCSNVSVDDSTYNSLPVKKLMLNRTFEVRDKASGSVDKGKMHYTILISSNVQEISRVLSFCVEGLQKYQNNIYDIVNCNNIESMK
jgi:hypothetical protein